MINETHFCVQHNWNNPTVKLAIFMNIKIVTCVFLKDLCDKRCCKCTGEIRTMQQGTVSEKILLKNFNIVTAAAGFATVLNIVVLLMDVRQ